jgi:hypothetical protein
MKMSSDVERIRTKNKMIDAIAEADAAYSGCNTNIVLGNEVILAVGEKK